MTAGALAVTTPHYQWYSLLLVMLVPSTAARNGWPSPRADITRPRDIWGGTPRRCGW